MQWNKLQITHRDRLLGKSFITITPDIICINSVSCDLINNFNNFGFVEIYHGICQNTSVEKIGFRFHKTETKHSINLHHRKYKNEKFNGAKICSRKSSSYILEKLKSSKTVRCPAEKIDENMLAIDIPSQ